MKNIALRPLQIIRLDRENIKHANAIKLSEIKISKIANVWIYSSIGVNMTVLLHGAGAFELQYGVKFYERIYGIYYP